MNRDASTGRCGANPDGPLTPVRGSVSACLVAVLLMMLAACAPDTPPIRIAETVATPVPDAGSLHVLEGGPWVIGRPNELLLGSPGDGFQSVRLPGEPDEAAPAGVLGSAPGLLLAGVPGGQLSLVDVEPREMRATRLMSGHPLLDPRGRAVFMAGASGEVMIFDTDSLAAISAWPSLDRPATALTASPEGDRVYLALENEDGSGTILTRDLQTGRILAEQSLPAAITALLADASGTLYILQPDADETVISAWQPRRRELSRRWRVRVAGDAARAGLRVGPDGRLLLLSSTLDTETGLHILDAETGSLLGSSPDRPLDAAFTPDGRILLLYPGEVRVVR